MSDGLADAVYALTELAAGRKPERSRSLAGVLASTVLCSTESRIEISSTLRQACMRWRRAKGLNWTTEAVPALEISRRSCSGDFLDPGEISRRPGRLFGGFFPSPSPPFLPFLGCGHGRWMAFGPDQTWPSAALYHGNNRHPPAVT
jgi:hypothetical protein